MSSLLRIENLSKSFKGLLANDDINMEIFDGDVRCIIGPNGAGKTTLISMISGHLKPTLGKLYFQNKLINKLSLVNRSCIGIGRKFQTPTLFDNLNVAQNVELSILRHNLSKKDILKKIDETLEIVRLIDKRDILANELSHGQRQWLEIGLLIGNNAKLLLLDEPTAGMTSEETYATTKLINQLSTEKNLSAIVIEHDINFVRELGAKITVLHLGKVFTEGTYNQIEKNKKVREIYLGKADA
jgi:ABC-type uncharacterized transport system ATPase subunit|tara:strand:+ start:934 stop:1659 length:726 start_codon:yes stop_codon:yes gene_type:complete